MQPRSQALRAAAKLSRSWRDADSNSAAARPITAAKTAMAARRYFTGSLRGRPAGSGCIAVTFRAGVLGKAHSMAARVKLAPGLAGAGPHEEASMSSLCPEVPHAA